MTDNQKKHMLLNSLIHALAILFLSVGLVLQQRSIDSLNARIMQRESSHIQFNQLSTNIEGRLKIVELVLQQQLKINADALLSFSNLNQSIVYNMKQIKGLERQIPAPALITSEWLFEKPLTRKSGVVPEESQDGTK